MDWSASTWWWVVTGGMVAAELATGTFYLLMMALGAAAAALASHAGLAFSWQLLAAAIVGGGAVGLLHWRRSRAPGRPPPSQDRDVNLDVGASVQVRHWNADGTARVHYRGADWSARFTGAGAPAPGPHVVRAVVGSELQLDRSA